MSLFELTNHPSKIDRELLATAQTTEHEGDSCAAEMQQVLSQTASLILDSVAHGRLLDAASQMQLIPGMARLVSLLVSLAGLKNEESLTSCIDRFSLLLSADPEFIWSLGEEAVARNKAKPRFTHFENFKPAKESNAGLSISVTNGERTQLRHDFSGGQQACVFAHYLCRTHFEGIAEPFAAIRWLHEGMNEEVVVRFRPSSVVLGQSIEVPVASATTYLLLSVGRHDGKDIVFVNGLPAMFRDAKTPSPTGVTLDVIGAHDLSSKVEIPLFVIDQNRLPPFFSKMDVEQWFHLMVEAFSVNGELDRLSRWMYAFAGLDATLSYEAYRLALSANLREPLGYRDYLTDALIEKLPYNLQQSALRDLAGNEPPAVLTVENATVAIASNPSLHASFSHYFGRHKKEITLLESIDFRAYAGDIVGIIGKNGAGKTTFLKTLVGAMPLSKGSISVDGRPILLRPGAGMQGDLTGRENILKTGLYMGFLPGEINELMDEIIEFAELEDHIDRPFRYYSDGMKARLVFSLATAIPRDILLLDELLSAGDMGFQRKAVKRLDDFIARAKLVFVVQHTFDFVLSRCTKCLLLEHGRPIYFGDPVIATELYKESL